MLSEEDKKKALNEIKNLKAEVTNVRSELNDLDAQKESWFEKKKAASKDIVLLISEITKFKQKRDDLTNQVKELKKERDEKNTVVKDMSSEMKRLDSEREELSKGQKLDFDPMKIKAQIEMIERKIETEGVSFNKEKVMMKQIKDLRKKYDEIKGLVVVLDKVSEHSRNMRKERRIAEKIHNTIQSVAKDSHIMHAQILEHSKKIDELRVKEKEAEESFLKFKKEFTEKHAQFKELSDKINDVSKTLGKDAAEFKEVLKEQKNKELSKMSVSVEEKIRTRQKLTTEDLLIFQAGIEKN